MVRPISYIPFYDRFETQSKEAYDKYVQSDSNQEEEQYDHIDKTLTVDTVVKKRKKELKIETEDQFVHKTKEIYNNTCAKIKDEEKRFKYAQELDKILIQIVKEIKEKETLQLASTLQKATHHRLQRFKSVCGYGLSGVFMKFEIKMLAESREQDQIIDFLVKVMQTVIDLKDKQVYDLVTFVVIGKLPVLEPDEHLKLEFTNNTEQNGHKSSSENFQTAGPLFEIQGEDDGLFLATCTHGKNFAGQEFLIYLNGAEPIKAQYWDSVYIEPKVADSGLTPNKAHIGVEKDLRKRPMSEAIDRSSITDDAKIERSSQSVRDTADTRSPLTQSPLQRNAPLRQAVKKTSTVSLADSGLGSSLESQQSSMSSLAEDDCCKDPTPTCSSTPISIKPGFAKALDRLSLSVTGTPISHGPDFRQNKDDRSLGPERLEDSSCDTNETPASSSFDGKGHIDLCFFKVDADKAKKCMSKLKRSDFILVKDIFKPTDEETAEKEMMNEKIIKYGVRTGVTEGRVVNWNDTFECIMNKEKVWMYNMIVSEQYHDYEEVVGDGQYSSSPVELVPDIKGLQRLESNPGQGAVHGLTEGGTEAGATGGQPLTLDPNAFVAPGDSGALFTTLPSGEKNEVQALSTHLYHYDTDANVYLKKLRYSVSAPLHMSIRELELKIGKKIVIKETPFPKA